jgi:tRNA(His) 5'-end guanylyltransferase
MLFERRINLAIIPTWQRRGIIIFREEYELSGFNPVLSEETISLRREVIQN